MGCIKDHDQANFWQSLFIDLKKAVLADKIACPESEYHTTEAMFDTRLEAPIRSVLDELSYGLKFHTLKNILELQIEEAALRFLNKTPIPKEPWTKAFTANPNVPIKMILERLQENSEKYSFLPMPELEIYWNRLLKNQWVMEEEALKSSVSLDRKELTTKSKSFPCNWNDFLLAERLSLINSVFGLKQKMYPGDFYYFSRIWKKLESVGIKISDTQTALNFLKSDHIMRMPFFDICCSIHAAINMHYPRRNPQGSDLYDVTRLAITIPYCHLNTTDSFMKEILTKRLRLDEKYNTNIFSATNQDCLSFQKRVKELINS